MSTVQTAAFGFVERLARDLEDERLDLPGFPDAVMRIQGALQSPDTSANDIVAILSSDPALAANILRTANSVVFRRPGDEITDLRLAVTRMGFSMVRTVATAFAMRQLEHHGTYSREGLMEIGAVWRESIQVASICYVLAKHYTHVTPDQALLTGLLHALGRLYVVMRAEDEDDLTGVNVREIAAGWQATIGKAILDSWGLPETMQQAVEQQDARNADFPGVSLIDVLIAAKVLADLENGEGLPRCTAIDRLSAAGHTDAATALETHGEEIQALRVTFGE